jgi:predicted AlkP superfamily phosphohydrolase/phosphomutase
MPGGSLRSGVALGALALLAALWAHPARGRVIVFGVDGACWRLLDAGIARGELPNFAAAAARGVTAEMETVEPLISPTVWTSIATGRSPDAHGVTDFFRNRTHVRVPTVFERLARRGLRVGLQEWLVTWPPRTIPNGFVIPDWLRRDERVSPAELFTRAGLTPYLYSMQGVRSLAEFDANAKREVAEKPRLFLALARAFELDVAAISFYSVDATSHRFWRAAFPDEFETPRTLEEEGFETTIRDTYRGVDAALGAVTASLAPEDSIVVVSDHGFRPEPATRRIWSLRLLDDPTRLGLDPMRDGFEIDGEFMAVVLRVLPGSAEKREAIVSRLTATLESIRTPGGEAALAVDVLPVAERPPRVRGSLWQRARAWGLARLLTWVYGVELDRPAYAFLLARPVDAVLASLWPDGELEAGERRFAAADLFRVDDFTGTHDETAVFLAAGGPIAQIGARDRVSVLDVAPLLLHLAGAPIPDDLERDVPVRLLDPARLAARPVRRVPAAELPGLPDEPEGAAVDDAVLLERLRALGYVD